MASQRSVPLGFLCFIAATSCGSGSGSTPLAGTDAGLDARSDSAALTDPQLPPAAGGDSIGAWIERGFYKSWRCEPTARPGNFPSPHNVQRVCANDLSANHGAGEFPAGAAFVKEVYDAVGGKITGYDVSIHVRTGKADAWYWYEKASGKVTTDDFGDNGSAKSYCVSCHEGAGLGYPGHDFVFSSVK